MSGHYKKISIGVSSCLLGNNVRYDGKNKDNQVIQNICSVLECIPLCPEEGIGLGIPRPPLQIVRIKNDFRARGKTNPGFDVTDRLGHYANNIVSRHPDICGYIFKARSPSCGINSTPWRNISGDDTGLTSGIYSDRISTLLPSLPVIEETQLANEASVKIFMDAVRKYAEKLDGTP